MIRPATCEGGEARRSRWTKADQHSVINEEKFSGTSKFEAALKDLEALGRGQGTRYFLIKRPYSSYIYINHRPLSENLNFT